MGDTDCMISKSKTINYRLDRELEPAVAEWLGKHPDIDMTTLNNMALRDFITKPHLIEAVEIVTASSDEMGAAVQLVMQEHADALEKLK